jgi:hypothetical protein
VSEPQRTINDVQTDINIAEMCIIAHLGTLPGPRRMSCALSLRARGRSDAVRFAHAAELSLRMPDLVSAVSDRGTITAEHLDTIWGRINRQLTTVPAGAVPEIRESLDSAVAEHITGWLVESPIPVGLTDLRDKVDEAMLDCAPGLAEQTSLAEQDSATLRRKGNTFILTAGSQTTSAAIADALDARTRERLAGLRKDRDLLDEDAAAELPGLPTPSEIKAQVLLDLLGDNPERMKIRVNLYRATTDGIHGTGAGYVPDVGWIDAPSADRLESVADIVKEIATEPASHSVSTRYPFGFTDNLYLDGRDAHCRFPNCTVPASQCENDHIENSPHTDPTSNGATHVSNGQKLCKAHHRAKTEGEWKCYTDDGGFTVHWSGPDGQSHTTKASGPLARFKGLRPDEIAELSGYRPRE